MSWENVKLGDVIQIKKGTYITKKESKEGPYPVILGGQEPAYYIDTFNHTGKAIVISRSGASAGYISFWNEPIFVTDGFLIEPKGKTSIDFLYYLLKSRQSELQGKQGGAAIPHVNPRTINAIEVVLPSPLIQKRIVLILSAYDNLIENNQKQIKLLEEAAQRLYKEWFVDLRFPGHENVNVVEGVPEGWQLSTVGECSAILRRGISPKYNEEGPSVVINQKCIRQSVVDLGEARRQEKAFAEEINLTDSDTVICSTGAGTLGRVGQVFGNLPHTTFDSHVTLVRASENIGKQYLYQFLKSKQEYLQGMGKGSTNQLELSRSTIQELPILTPDCIISEMFEQQAQRIHDKIAVLSKQIAFLREARDILLPKLMSGEIEV